jgi:hypothetical protein
MHDKFAAVKTRLHFPRVIRVFALRSVHCFTGIVLGHRRCLPGTAGKTKPERRAPGCFLSLQPYVHPKIMPHRQWAISAIRVRREDRRRRFRTARGSRKWHPRAGYITFRPFRAGLGCLNVLPAGGRAFQRAVTKLKVHWSTPSPPVQPCVVTGLSTIMRLRRLIALLALSFLFLPQLLTQTPTPAPGSGASAAQASSAPHRESAKTECTDAQYFVRTVTGPR